MEAKQLVDLGKDSTDNENTYGIYAAASYNATRGLSSINTSNSAPDLFDDELFAF